MKERVIGQCFTDLDVTDVADVAGGVTNKRFTARTIEVDAFVFRAKEIWAAP